MANKFDQLQQTLGTMISWIGQSANTPLSPDDCAKLLAMLPPPDVEDMLDKAMQLHRDINSGGITGPLAVERKRLLELWDRLKKNEGRA